MENKYSFKNDYSDFAHPKLIEAILNHSNEQNTGYELDQYTHKAGEKIKEVFGSPKGKVFFLTGGTQTNMTVISYLLRPYEAALACTSGHINTLEGGAIEGTGHKIITVEGINGKLTKELIENAMKTFTGEHKPKIKLVYISNSTEFGTIYFKKELEEIYQICKVYDLFLFIDGARLGCALTSSQNDIKPEEYGSLCDVFYVGGTKLGLLSGEAVVFNDFNLCKDFRCHMKNRGAMLAKGFVLGLQFFEVFNQNLYFELGKHENKMAEKFKNALTKLNVKFIMDSPTNQQFPIFTKEHANKILDLYNVDINKDLGNEICLRFCFSWATKEEKVDEAINNITKILGN